MKNKIFALLILSCLSFVKPQHTITIWMIGDSTMANKLPKAYPETGWGMAFGQFFNDKIKIENRALNGRSTLSFRNEKRWASIMDSLKKGDYVFIQFGHNDEKINKPGIGTSIAEYKNNLALYVTEARSKKAIPVLLTPIMRHSFKNGEFIDTHGEYPTAMKQVADSLSVPLIDMQAKTKNLITSMGEEGSTILFNYVEPGHPNYPQGKKDDTHLSPLGAQKVAALAAEGIKELKINLANYLIKQKRCK